MRVSIAPNPSHLEYVGPVVLGMVRAEQTRLQDHTRSRVMGLLIHGDAAFAGLGVVAETLSLADVPGGFQQHTAAACAWGCVFAGQVFADDTARCCLLVSRWVSKSSWAMVPLLSLSPCQCLEVQRHNDRAA